MSQSETIPARRHREVWGTDVPLPDTAIVLARKPDWSKAQTIGPEGGRDRSEAFRSARWFSPGETFEAVQGSGAEMYAGGAFGGGTTVVPTLQFSSQRAPTAAEAVRSNPVLAGPCWSIGFRMGAIPVKVFALDPETGRRKPSLTHPAYRLLRNPNPVLTRNLMIAGSVVSALMYGKVGWWKSRDAGGKVRELWPIPGWCLWPRRNAKRILDAYVLRPPGRQAVLLRFEDVVFHRLMPAPWDWADGWSPLAYLGQVGDFAGGAMDAMAQAFYDGLLQRIALVLDGELDEVGRERLHAEIDAMRERKYRVPFLEPDTKVVQLGDQINEQLLGNAFDLAAKIVLWAFGASSLTEDKAFYGQIVAPVADAFEQEWERSLFPEFGETAFAEFQFREVLAGDPGARATMWKDKILSAQATPNEAREAENQEPKEGGDQLFVPLNLVPIGTVREQTKPEEAPGDVAPAGEAASANGGTPAKDSSGGLGGSEGKDTMAKAKAARRNRLRAASKVNWGRLRDRSIAGRATAASRRVRGLLKAELVELRSVALGTGRSRTIESGLPAPEELHGVLDARTQDLPPLLRGYMAQVSADAWRLAEELLGSDEQEIADRLEEVLAERAAAVGDRWAAIRAADLEKVLGSAVAEGWSARELADGISERWGFLSANLADGIARTEVAFGYEQGAMLSWAQAGVRQAEVVFGGGPCTTGICEEAEAGSPYDMGEGVGDVGFSFDGAEAPPLHPSCTCYSVPYVPEAG